MYNSALPFYARPSSKTRQWVKVDGKKRDRPNDATFSYDVRRQLCGQGNSRTGLLSIENEKKKTLPIIIITIPYIKHYLIIMSDTFLISIYTGSSHELCHLLDILNDF